MSSVSVYQCQKVEKEENEGGKKEEREARGKL